jgi:hypothetical protein
LGTPSHWMHSKPYSWVALATQGLRPVMHCILKEKLGSGSDDWKVKPTCIMFSCIQSIASFIFSWLLVSIWRYE